MIDADTLRRLDEAEVERVCRAMQAVSRPDVDPDKLTPGPRGTVGLIPVWRQYEHMARAAILAMVEENAQMLRIMAVFDRHYRANDCDGRSGDVSIPVSALRAAASFLSARAALNCAYTNRGAAE